MSTDHAHVTLEGRVTHVFGHRFVLETTDGSVLADLGPKGEKLVEISVGQQLSVSGEQKPGEVKVYSLLQGARTTPIRSGEAPDHGDDDPEAALAAVRTAGFEPIGPVVAKPKHFEITGRRGDSWTKFHVEFDGSIRKAKTIEAPPQGGEK